MFVKILATIHTMWTQLNCDHGPWIKDQYSRIYGTDSAHCQKCWKTKPAHAVNAREETLEEWMLRATKGGLSTSEALNTWEISQSEKSK
jgi:hypothetical protein